MIPRVNIISRKVSKASNMEALRAPAELVGLGGWGGGGGGTLSHQRGDPWGKYF